MTTTHTPPILTTGPARRTSRRHLVVFLLLAYGLSWWPLLGRMANPDSAAMFPIGPSIAALVVTGWAFGPPARRALLRSAINARLGRWWWAVAVPIAVSGAASAAAVLVGAGPPSGVDLAGAAMVLATLPIILVVGGPLGEELGWRGYLLPLFLRRHSPIVATLLLAPLWLGFHLPQIITEPDRYGLWWAMTVIGIAFVMTWLHLGSGGSVLLAIIFHAVANTAAKAAITMFPEPDQQLAGQLTAVAWVVAAVVAARQLRRHHV